MKSGTFKNEKRAYKWKEAIIIGEEVLISDEKVSFTWKKGHAPETNRGTCENEKGHLLKEKRALVEGKGALKRFWKWRLPESVKRGIYQKEKGHLLEKNIWHVSKIKGGTYREERSTSTHQRWKRTLIRRGRGTYYKGKGHFVKVKWAPSDLNIWIIIDEGAFVRGGKRIL